MQSIEDSPDAYGWELPPTRPVRSLFRSGRGSPGRGLVRTLATSRKNSAVRGARTPSVERPGVSHRTPSPRVQQLQEELRQVKQERDQARSLSGQQVGHLLGKMQDRDQELERARSIASQQGAHLFNKVTETEKAWEYEHAAHLEAAEIARKTAGAHYGRRDAR